MNENVRKVFDILGIEPDIRVKIDSGHRADEFMFDEELNQYRYVTDVCGNEIRWCVDGVIANILTGKYKVVQQPKFTELEQKAIDLYKELEYKWIAKDTTDGIFAYTAKPSKHLSIGKWVGVGYIQLPPELKFNSLHWSDEKPYYIGE